MGATSNSEKLAAAEQILPCYNAWHRSCMEQCGVPLPRLEQDLLTVAARYKHLKVPQKMGAAVGRWAAKQLGLKRTAFNGIQ